jgi:hypothetical protein
MFDSSLRTTTSFMRALEAATLRHIHRALWDPAAVDVVRDRQLALSRQSLGAMAHDHWVVHASGRLVGCVIDVFTPELIAACDQHYRACGSVISWDVFMMWSVSDHLPVLARMTL